MDSYLFLFLLLAYLAVGICSIIVFGALGDALNGGFSPIVFVVTASAVTGLCVILPLPTMMSYVSLAIVSTALALLFIPVKRRRFAFRPVSRASRVALALIFLVGALSAYSMHAGKRVLRNVGMTDAWETEIQGYVLQLFVDFCIGLILATIFLLIIRIREELQIRQSDLQTLSKK